MKKILILEEIYKLLFENINDYSKWKRKNVTLRGMKSIGVDNGVWGSFGRGLYTVPLGNKSMAKEYGDVYFVVNAIPKNPKVVNGMNNAELWRQDLVEKFCKAHGVDYSVGFFEKHTSIEKEMLKLRYDGFVIKGREMVNYAPENIKYFRTEDDLKNHFESEILKIND